MTFMLLNPIQPQGFFSISDPGTVLLISAAPQGGQRKSADAIGKALELLNPSSIRSSSINVIHHFYPVLGTLIAKTYFEILRSTPQLWDFLYDNHQIEQITREFRQFFHFFNASKLESLLKQYHYL